MHDRSEGVFDDIPLAAGQRHAEVPLQQPCRHDLHLHGLPRVVERGQAFGADMHLHAEQGVECIGVKGVDGVVIEFRQVGACAEILDEQEALCEVRDHHGGHV